MQYNSGAHFAWTTRPNAQRVSQQQSEPDVAPALVSYMYTSRKSPPISEKRNQVIFSAYGSISDDRAMDFGPATDRRFVSSVLWDEACRSN